MLRRNNKIGTKGADTITFSLYLALVVIGWLMIYSAGAGVDGYPDNLASFLFYTPIGKQTIWIIISFATFFGVFVFFDHLVWFRTAYPIYIGTIISLVAVLLFGVEIKGATSWFRMGGFTIQP
ncbi:MAG: FtsW/RodA/SpoVE family cell cycle protein, partial [Bacteroidota bacterium]